MNFCLSDLVPPLRWSDASTITLLTGQPELPDAWWRSLPMPRVLAAIGPESLGELLTEIALEHWPAAAVGDVLPALHVLDPDEADEPQVAIALDRAGSWTGLLALTGRELVDQPFIQARPVLNTLFSAVLVRLAPQLQRPAPFAELTPFAAFAAAAPVAGQAPVAAEAPVAEQVPVAAEAPVAERAPFAEQAPPVEASAGGEAPPAEEVPETEEAAEEVAAGEEAAAADEPVLDADAEPVVEEAAEPEPEPVLDAADEPAPEPAAEEAAALEAEGAEPEAAPEPEAVEAVPESEPVAEDAKPRYDTPADFEAAESEDQESGAAPEQQPDERGGHELPELIEAAFAGLDDKSWAVAQNRVFTDQPSAVDQLAKLFAVPAAEISATETEFRARLGQWLASEEAAPYRAHLDELRRTIGPAAPKERLIGAADWHAREIRALEVPAWQFVLATLPSEPPAAAPPAPEPQVVEAVERPVSAFAQVPPIPSPPPGTPQFQAFAPAVEVIAGEGNGASGEHPKPYQPLKDVSQTRRCFRQPDGRWWLRIDVTAEQLTGGECALPTGFATYLGLSPGESRTVRSAAGELTMTWHGRPVLESVERLLADVGAKEGGHLFLTLSDEGVLRARHLPVAAQGAEKITKALRLVGYTAPGGTRDQAARVIATRIGMTGPVGLPDLLTRLRERGDRDLLQLLD
ncbi:hypothetical protein [Nonomuraea sp. NEAU-A123]|uniref:hypothetical protein n=1 Tax=Nonomuraea sp. NEAU-A123 TaxID=2839649 RepID=UPI001BE3E95C|nr:hypothetical protein [Nonomuraea sp. NEAU-A123]MBT2230923.1 hypothetical protein [Nonomuraea sp. NEAU-A123]